jgi:hypothetical protein
MANIVFEIPDQRNHLRKDIDSGLVSLNAVCQTVFGRLAHTIKEVERPHGRYVVGVNESTGERSYIVFSSKNNSRNAFLMQYIAPAYIAYSKDSVAKKSFHIYVIDPKDKNAYTPYMKLFYRCFLNLTFKIHNLEVNLVPFSNFEEMQKEREQERAKNSMNQSTYFEDNGTHIAIYGKTFGANAMESFLLALTLKQLSPQRVIFYPVTDNGSNNLSEEQIEILKANGIDIKQAIDESSSDETELKAAPESLRDSPKFHYNLLKKFGRKYCYICGCEIGNLIIGSHIHRVADIQNSDDSKQDKVRKIVDGDNGFFLCANHDKLFEWGWIFFAGQTLRFKPYLTLPEKNYIRQITFDTRKLFFELEDDPCVKTNEQGYPVFEIAPKDYNPNMETYLAEHRKRLGVD